MHSLSAFKDNIAVHFKNQLPFVVYNQPDSDQLIGLLQKTNRLHSAKGFKNSGFVFAPFQKAKASVLIPDKESEELLTTLEPSFFKEVAAIDNESSPAIDPAFESLVVLAKEKIKNGSADKIVCSRQIRVDFTVENSLDLLMDLFRYYKSAFTYGFYHPKLGFWMGATPETLIDVSGTTFKTMALAGTQKVRENQNPNWSLKEINEQYFVTQAISEGLQPLVKVIVVSKTYNKLAGDLWHICNDISGTLKNKKELLARVVNALHPTPAVCGLPELIAKKFILKHEAYDREYYTGFLGRLTPELNAKLYVNLRCIKIEDNYAYIYVGAGITEDSHPLDEWVETAHKSLTMKRLLSPYLKFSPA